MPTPPRTNPLFPRPDVRPLRGVLLLAAMAGLALWAVLAAVVRPLCVPSHHGATIAPREKGVLFNRQEEIGP